MPPSAGEPMWVSECSVAISRMWEATAMPPAGERAILLAFTVVRPWWWVTVPVSFSSRLRERWFMGMGSPAAAAWIPVA